MNNKDNQAQEINNQSSDNLDLEQLIEQLKVESAYNLVGWQRAQADYQNLKKESEQARIDSIKLSNKALIENFIPVFDNFAIATKHLPEDLQNNNWVQGIVYIHKQLQDILIAEGVEIINPIGEIFDPNIHEAVETVESEDAENQNTIIEVLQVGYKLNGRLIRSARVKVSS
ncbi:nucleotide exchange factor GrpE [bacterium]|nr:nucleotide exchange factor GrpE [Candidatus Elulimicrobium humile]